MIRMTKQADYGIVLLTRMAGEPHRLFNAAELAEEAQLPAPTVAKILKLLAREGVLESHRGVKGGYTLAQAPQETTVAEVIEALEGPIAITECIDDSPGDCAQEAVCSVRANWQRINQAIRGALERISLAEMAQVHSSGLVTLGGASAGAGRDQQPAR